MSAHRRHESYAKAGEPRRTVGAVLNWASWLTFGAELVLMLAVVESRSRGLQSHSHKLAIRFLSSPFLSAALQAAIFRLLRLLAAAALFLASAHAA